MDVLKVGDIYKSKDLAHQAVETFCENNHVTFRRRSSSSKQLIFKCKHGFSRKSMCSGKRPKQTVSYLACKAKICFYVNIEGEAHLKQFKNEHTHPIDKEIFDYHNQTYNDEDQSLIMQLNKVNTPHTVIAQCLNKRTPRNITRIQIRNYVNKMFPVIEEDRLKNLQNYVLQIKDEGGCVSFLPDSDCTLKALFLSTEPMMRALRHSVRLEYVWMCVFFFVD